MKMSVREARANFSSALDAAQRGEHVTITRNGKAIAALGPPPEARNGFDWERMQQVRKDMGFDKLLPDTRTDEEWFADFNDPIFTEMMLGKYATDDEELARS